MTATCDIDRKVPGVDARPCGLESVGRFGATCSHGHTREHDLCGGHHRQAETSPLGCEECRQVGVTTLLGPLRPVAAPEVAP